MTTTATPTTLVQRFAAALLAAMDGYISDVAAYDTYLETQPPASLPLIRERPKAAPDRRPHSDRTGALQATRLGIALTAGSRS